MQNVFFLLMTTGAICGLCYESCKIIKRISKNNIFITNVANFIYFCAVGLCFCSFLIKNCSGELKIYYIFAFVLGLVLEQISVGFFFTKFYKLVYNVFTKILRKLKSKKIVTKILR